MVLVYYFAFNKSYLLMGSLNRYLLNQIFNQQKQFLYLVSISTEKGQLVKLQLSKNFSSKLNTLFLTGQHAEKLSVSGNLDATMDWKELQKS